MRLFLLLFIAIKTFAQAPVDSSTHFWFSAGPTFSMFRKGNTLTGMNFSLNASLKRYYFLTAGVEGKDDFRNFPFGTDDPNSLLSVDEAFLLIGYGKFFKPWFAVIGFTGLSYGKAYYQGDLLYLQHSSGGYGFPLSNDTPIFDDEKYNYVGVPLKIRTLLTGHQAGFAIDLFYNIRRHPDFGFGINLCLGRIRK